MAKSLKKCLTQDNYHWQHGDSVSGRYGIFLESEEGDKYSEFIYYLEAHSASRIVIDFNEENMRCLLEYLEMVLGKIDLDDDFAQQMYASGTLY